MTTNVLTKADLTNIDYNATCLLNGGFSLSTRDLYGQFNFALKDGRIFVCKQDLDKTFFIHSDEYSTVMCNWWGKMFVDASYNAETFFKKVKTIEKTAKNLVKHLNNVSSREIVEHKMADIVMGLYGTTDNMFIELIKMGLDDNNEFVTIEQVL